MKHLRQETPAYAAEVETELRDLGIMGYQKAHDTQLQCVEKVLHSPDQAEVILITEHPAVFTLGRKGETHAFIRKQDDIVNMGVDIIHTERGGDITYHGPGQLVVYPIINLHRRKLSVTRFIHLLEEVMLNTAADFQVASNRDKRNRGIWVGNNKLGSVGIRVRHGVTFHGLALNINLDLNPFSWIQPCGLSGVGVTSLAHELGNNVNMEAVKERMKGHLADLICH